MIPKLTSELIARVFLVASGLVCLYLGVISLGGSSGCGDGAGCGEVISSEWSRLVGVPVAFIGMAVYFAAAFFGKPECRAVSLRGGLLLVIPVAAAWFVGVQLFAVGSFCLWCCAAHLLASTGAILLLVKAPGSIDRVCVAGAVASVLAFAAVQILLPGAGAESRSASSVVSVFSMADPKGGADLALHGGEMSFDIAGLPTAGSEKAERHVLALTDYTCQHCRTLHPVLDEVATYLGENVSIIKLPATRKGSDSAEIHSDMLALWKVSPDAFRSLERSLVEGRVPPTADRVSVEARRLVSANRLATSYAKNREWIEKQLAATRQLQDANRAKTGRGTLPQVMIGSEIVFGSHPEPGYYLKMIESEFGGATAGSVARPKPASIVQNGSSIDLGEVVPGSETPFEIAFTNTSDMPLEVSWVNLDQGVALKRYPRGEIFPGEEAKLALVLELDERNSTPGSISRVITVNTSSGHPSFTFKLTAQIDNPVAQVPGEL